MCHMDRVGSFSSVPDILEGCQSSEHVQREANSNVSHYDKDPGLRGQGLHE